MRSRAANGQNDTYPTPPFTGWCDAGSCSWKTSYLVKGAYTYRGGWSTKAVAATAFGCALAWSGLLLPPLAPLVDYGWFVGAFGSAGLYLALHRLSPDPRVEVAASP